MRPGSVMIPVSDALEPVLRSECNRPICSFIEAIFSPCSAGICALQVPVYPPRPGSSNNDQCVPEDASCPSLILFLVKFLSERLFTALNLLLTIARLHLFKQFFVGAPGKDFRSTNSAHISRRSLATFTCAELPNRALCVRHQPTRQPSDATFKSPAPVRASS